MSTNNNLSKLDRLPLREDAILWSDYLAWFTQRLVKMDQVLRPIVKALP